MNFTKDSTKNISKGFTRGFTKDFTKDSSKDFTGERFKNFVEVRMNRDNLFNLFFWLGMTCWVYFSLPAHPMVALSSLIGMPFIIKQLSPLKVVEQRPELILEFPDTASLYRVRLKEKIELSEAKQELPETRQCLATSDGRIVSDGAPNLFCVLLSPMVIGFVIAYIFDDFMNSIDVALAGCIGVATFFFIPVSIFILYNRPISLLFDSRAWYLQGWRSRPSVPFSGMYPTYCPLRSHRR